MSDKKYCELLAGSGLRVTNMRLRVLKTLGKAKSALSHQEISDAVGSIDRVTLYRILYSLERNKIIHRVATTDRQTRFALCMKDGTSGGVSIEHVHFECNQCHRVYCLPKINISISTSASENDGFYITNRELLLHGICPGCAKTEKKQYYE